MPASDAVGGQADGVDLPASVQGGDIGKAPGMNVEHRRDRHVDVVGVEPALAGALELAADAERVNCELAMAEIDALGQAVIPVV